MDLKEFLASTASGDQRKKKPLDSHFTDTKRSKVRANTEVD